MDYALLKNWSSGSVRDKVLEFLHKVHTGSGANSLRPNGNVALFFGSEKAEPQVDRSPPFSMEIKNA